jgi:regulator of extracellular matrix RemA (YlzA/DUF370 family)
VLAGRAVDSALSDPSGGAFLDQLSRLLDDAGLAFMVVGSVAATRYGLVRSTVDVDVVVDADEGALLRFVTGARSRGWYADETLARRALANRRQFNVIDALVGWKADVIVRKTGEFDDVAFGRRTRDLVLGTTTSVATAEDVLLSKLSWAAISGSDRQVEDVTAMLRVCGASIDRSYVEKWARALGVLDLWQRIADR